MSTFFQSLLMRMRLLFYKLQCFFLNHPLALKLWFAFLRRFRPTVSFKIFGKPFAVVTKAGDVRDTLYRMEDFNNAEVLSAKMPWGPFVVDIDWPEQHDRERALLESIIGTNDVETIRKNAAAICQAQIAAARPANEIDVVSGLCGPVVVDMVQKYLGVPAMGTPGEAAHILSRVAGIIMVDPPAGSKPWHDARFGLTILTNAISQKIVEVPKLASTPDDLLARFTVKLQSGKGNPAWFDESWIRRYITGLTVFGGGTVVRAATHAIDRLMAHPAGLRQARELAKQLNGSLLPQARQQIQSKLLQIIYEALRFRPMLPVLVRYVPRETMIAKGAAHARMPPPGCLLVAPPLAAMHDPEEFPRPGEFGSDRCMKNYVHFGHGPRLCFGKYIADVLFVEIVCALLLLDGLKRARCARGRIKYEGPAVKSCVLTFNG